MNHLREVALMLKIEALEIASDLLRLSGPISYRTDIAKTVEQCRERLRSLSVAI